MKTNSCWFAVYLVACAFAALQLPSLPCLAQQSDSEPNVDTSAITTTNQPVITLQQAIDYALTNGSSLQIAKEKVQEQKGAQYSALGPLLPMVTTNTGPEVQQNLLPSSSPAGTQLQTGLSVAVPLMDVSSTLQLRAKHAQLQQAVASVATQKSELIYKTALAYVDAVLAVRVARLTKLQLASFQKQQSSVKRRLQEGLAHQADLQRAQLDTLTSRSKLLRAQNKQQQKLLQLAAIMQYNKPFAVAQQTQLPAWEFAKQPPQQLAQQAMAQRAKVKDRQLAIEMAKREHAAAWWDLFPSMQATAGVSHAAPLAGGDLQETLTWRAGAALLWSPYKGGTRYGNMRQTRSRIGQQRLQLQALTWEIWQHTHQQHHRLITLQQRVHMAQQAFSTSQQLHRSTVDLYNNGQATVLELSAAERDLANAEIGLAQVRSDLQRAQLDLAYTVGLLQQLTIATKLL